MLPLPHALWERGIRRYGFHGLSYEYMAIALAERHGDAARGRTIVAHLGSGASLCAMQGLHSVATTMGFSALDGLMMGTRCGSLDPGVLLHLMEVEELDAQQLDAAAVPRVRPARRLRPLGRARRRCSRPRPRIRGRARRSTLYVRRIVREIGALTAVLGGLDMLAFTAGVGEHSAVLRERICGALGWLGVRIDDDGQSRRTRRTISARAQPRARRRRADQRGMDRGLARGARASKGASGMPRRAPDTRTGPQHDDATRPPLRSRGGRRTSMSSTARSPAWRCCVR